MAQGARPPLVYVYAAVAALSTILIFRENVNYASSDLGASLASFVRDAASTHAGRSMSLDLFLLSLSAGIWMIGEAKRLGIKHAWLYIAAGFPTAIAITFPLFMIHRELRLRDVARPPSGAPASTRR